MSGPETKVIGAARVGPLHGTYAAYQGHKRRGEDPCPDCRAANAAYARLYRAERQGQVEAERQMTKVRSRALWRLSREYPDRFRDLVIEELAADQESSR